MRKFIKNNLFGFILGAVMFGGVGTVLATVILASNISFTPSDTNWNVNNVQDALNDLNTKSNDWIDPSTIETNSSGKVFASSKGIIIRRKSNTHFFKINNWNVEQTHIQQVFSDISCEVDSSYVYCDDSDFSCVVNSSGGVYCIDHSDISECSVDSSGSVDCD